MGWTRRSADAPRRDISTGIGRCNVRHFTDCHGQETLHRKRAGVPRCRVSERAPGALSASADRGAHSLAVPQPAVWSIQLTPRNLPDVLVAIGSQRAVLIPAFVIRKRGRENPFGAFFDDNAENCAFGDRNKFHRDQ
jgi:hypothetical protein